MDDLSLNRTMLADAVKAAPAQGNLEGRKKISPLEAGKAAEDFEAMFVSQMLAPMWEGVETDGMFGGGSAEETFRGMMINEYGRLIAKTGGLGIASDVKAELLRHQEAADTTPKTTGEAS